MLPAPDSVRAFGARLALVLGLAAPVATGCRASHAPPDEPPRAVTMAPPSSSFALTSVDAGRGSKNSNGTPKHLPLAPPDVPGKMHVLVYEDFGPQVMAEALLGPECYSFGACCCSEPSDSFDVRVVVHRDTEPAEVARRYPTGPDFGDYRLVPLAKARAYLVARISELRAGREPDDGRALRDLESRLARTLASLDLSFPRESRPHLRDAGP
jgi:hypothetical protein